ncbi:LCP family glycopolymer transferase [Oceanobacillus halotolerans]|uniref:LCP family glycopolymer transferase n=1 Tax=Oceanobacillus halotolerans TaxID=2663380 RepID=UPI0013D02A97|nr:LCP family protein [Oceanobacillus halotolerans]
MDDHKWKELFSHLDDESLQFTKGDRDKTMAKIKADRKKVTDKRLSIFRLGPSIATVMALIIAAGVLLPLILSESNEADRELASDNEYERFSLLLIGEGYTKRTELNLLVTYNEGRNSMKVVPLPRDLYVSIQGIEGNTIHDKLTHAAAYGGGSEAVQETISEHFKIPVDYYASLHIEDAFDVLGIHEPIRHGYVVNKLEENLNSTVMTDLIAQSETNISDHQFGLLDHEYTIDLIDVSENLETVTNDDDIYYVQLDEEVLQETTELLKSHLEYNE